MTIGCGKDDKPNPNPAPTPNPNSGDPKVPPSGPSDPKPSADPSAELLAAKPELTTTATEWAALVKKNPNETITKYQGKVIELSGLVADLGYETDDTFQIGLKTGDDSLNVKCVVADTWEKFSIGSEVTVRGKVGRLLAGWLDAGVVVKAGTNPATTLKASDLASQIKADASSAGKYARKWICIEGEVLVGGKEDLGLTFLIKGEGDINVTCGVPLMSRKVKAAALALKPGQKVKVMGQFNNFSNKPTLNQTVFKVQ